MRSATTVTEPIFEKMRFTATLPRPLEWILPGNTMLYSLNESFQMNILWKFIVFPARVAQLNQIESFIEKWQNGLPIPFQQSEAISAIKGVFTGVYNIMVPPAATQLMQSVPSFTDSFVAFTLRIFDASKRPRLELTQNRNKENLNCLIQTGTLKPERNAINVFGLLTTPGQICSLEDCSQILAGIFDKDLITWLSYCTNPDAWKYYAGIPLLLASGSKPS